MHYLWYTFYLKIPDLITTKNFFGGGVGGGRPPPPPHSSHSGDAPEIMYLSVSIHLVSIFD